MQPNHDQEIAALRSLLEREIRRNRELESRLLALENSRFFRLLRWPGRFLLDWKGRAGQLLLHSPLHPLYRKLTQRAGTVDPAYQSFVANERLQAPAVDNGPLISVVTPVYNQPLEWLEAAVESVRAQTYPRWQLCLCDDGSSDPAIRAYLERMSLADPRIVFTTAPHGGISAASNRAAAMATGDYLALLDADDVLAPEALAFFAAAIVDRAPDLLYSDEDRLDESGGRVDPIFRPDWSPELLLSCMYMTHLLAVRRELFQAIGGFRPVCDGAQDYDVALRATADPAVKVEHIPHVLYHWRTHAASTASSAAAFPATHAAGKRAVNDAVAQRGIKAAVEGGPIANSYRVRRAVIGEPRAALIICSADARRLDRCISAIGKKTAYARREIVVVQHGWSSADARYKAVPYSGRFDFAKMNNLAARQTTADILVFLNDDTAPLDPQWLEALIAQAQRADVGAVGAQLLYPSGAIQHAGLVTGILHGVAHIGRNMFATPYWQWLPYAREVSAVTGACVAIRRELFLQIGGFDEAFPVNYNDADLCLRLQRAGYRILYEPAAVLRHDEARTRTPGIRLEEEDLWFERWPASPDPYYSPNLTQTREDAGLGG